MADVPPMPAGLELAAPEAAQRERVMAAGGALAATMRSLEARPWSPGWLAEVWLWVLFLLVVRGYRGSTTVAEYAAQLGRFGEWVRHAGHDYATLTVGQVDDWQKWLYMVRRNGAQMRRLALMAVRSFFRWRASRGFGADVTRDYSPPKRVHRAPRKYTTKQLRLLFEAARLAMDPRARLRDTTMLLVLLSAGLRREEIANLRVDQLELSQRAGIVHVFGKGSKERQVPVEGPVVRKLMEWLDVRAKVEGVESDAVFVSLDRRAPGKAITVRSVESVVKRCAKRAGLREWGVHRFRVTFATTLYDDGTDIERIRVLMGHETIETTRRYISISGRMNTHRMASHRQHEAMGTIPDDMPLWARKLEQDNHGTGILKPR